MNKDKTSITRDYQLIEYIFEEDDQQEVVSTKEYVLELESKDTQLINDIWY